MRRSSGAGEGRLLDRLTVLIVEDDQDTREMYAEYLQHHGACAIEAATLGDARLVLGSVAPDAVVIDLGLREEDGHDLLREMSRHGAWAGVPCVIASGRPGSTHRAARGIRFLQKPVVLEDLVAAIREAQDAKKRRGS